MRTVKPTVKAFVRRLELMINHIDGRECEAVCPGRKGFIENKDMLANIGLHKGETWCHTCCTFMDIIFGCPCYYYKPKGIDPIAEALSRIKEWREAND